MEIWKDIELDDDNAGLAAGEAPTSNQAALREESTSVEPTTTLVSAWQQLKGKTVNLRSDLDPEWLRLWVNWERPNPTQGIRNVTLAELQDGSPLQGNSKDELVTHGKLHFKNSKISKNGLDYELCILSSPDSRPMKVLIFNSKARNTIGTADIGCTIGLLGFTPLPDIGRGVT